jgi:hypothetical protein
MREKTISFFKHTLIFRNFTPSKYWCVAIVTPEGNDIYYYKPKQRLKELEYKVKHFVQKRYSGESQASFEIRDSQVKRFNLKQLRRRHEETNKNQQPGYAIL